MMEIEIVSFSLMQILLLQPCDDDTQYSEQVCSEKIEDAETPKCSHLSSRVRFAHIRLREEIDIFILS